MIEFEHFHALKEAQSLDLKIKGHLANIKQEENRIQIVHNQRVSKAKELEDIEKNVSDLTTQLRSNEKNLAAMIAQHEKATQRIPRLTSDSEVKATEKEIAGLEREKAKNEKAVLELMESIDSLNKVKIEHQSFLQGSEQSLSQIKDEVKLNTDLDRKEIANYEKRMAVLLDTCHPNTRARFLALNQLYRFRNPLAFVINDNCNGCHMKINRRDQINIDKGQTLEYCPSCGRIFLPTSLK